MILNDSERFGELERFGFETKFGKLMTITYEDLENIKDSLTEKLRLFEGTAAEKKTFDSTYSKIYAFFKELSFAFDDSKIPGEERKSFPLEVSYSVEKILEKELELQNLNLDLF